MPIKTALSIGLRTIPSANRKPGFLAEVARFGKPARIARQDTSSTSFKPNVILPDPKIKAARALFQKALQKHIDGIRELMRDAIEPGEVEYWRKVLTTLGVEF